ncbi:MAG: 4Fe-4S binding protein [Candidatus Paceibacterota bacterium]
MEFKVDKSICIGCGACIGICPNGAIKIEKDGKSSIDQKKCKHCGECQKVCPMKAIKVIKKLN